MLSLSLLEVMNTQAKCLYTTACRFVNRMCSKEFILLFMVLCYAKGQNQNKLSEGSPCWVNEKNGTCVGLYRCVTASAYFVYRNAGLIETVRKIAKPKECFRREDGEIFVCCTDCELDDTEELRHNVPGAYGVLQPKEGPKAWRKCLEYLRDLPYPCNGATTRTLYVAWNDDTKCDNLGDSKAGLGGFPAGKWQFPHMALLGYGQQREDAQWLCGGAIISERYILTAGHCTSTPSLGSVTFAGLGVLTRSELTDYWKIYKIRTIIKHPEYRPPSKYHDIALLETELEINFGRGILPACLEFGRNNPYWGVAPGWGRLGHRGQLAEHLMVFELQQYNETTCSAIFPEHRLLKRGYDVNTQVCFGRRDKVVDTCEGDSGGPLQLEEHACLYYIYGVTSYGKDCGIPGSAGMYTRVSHYVPWIESIVWPDP